ncbi:MAG: phosphomannose isomerase type II C-terminal cupin domain [Candidatus Omnitrophica bacterium]|nr:phosphomannose isomerase type II C-terminal cupin domain [Candidatus Omnitrophota bacterium]
MNTLETKYTEKRPWGQFEKFTSGEPTTVKILSVNPHQALSLQYHHKREEFWKVIAGNGNITIDDTVYSAKEGDEFLIKKEQKHRISTNDSHIKVLEISFGEFDENDIVRIEDIYNR